MERGKEEMYDLLWPIFPCHYHPRSLQAQSQAHQMGVDMLCPL